MQKGRAINRYGSVYQPSINYWFNVILENKQVSTENWAMSNLQRSAVAAASGAGMLV